ncbi:MAG: class I SAM-dependent methyltransferase [Bacteroidota bacterium]
MKIIDLLHEKFIYQRRIKILACHLAKLIPQNASVLDVGCGDGLLDRTIMTLRTDITICGIDVLIRGNSHIAIREFDGKNIPFDSSRFDVVMFIDVLHHTKNPEDLLKEAVRVSRGILVLKDHLKHGIFAGTILKLMDDIGNYRHGINLVYNYFTKKEWDKTFASLGLSVTDWDTMVRLYPWPLSLVFGRILHFIARLNLPQKYYLQ